ncbi:SDR family oxidoreductase [Mesonia sp. K7]|uniref:SDR family oxidoreductase n=1 Tax=Mesonia sp. K7 TaxID=2218606 RepID=UPI000DAABF1F|nr:SDR family oxidoreductase [Mesonia sp. K7]PZD79591.1 short-chain dehydrogenase/reductase [Mesonia sp. K7]
MSQKVVFITGASSGIGKSIAEFLVQKNYRVYGTSRNPKQIEVNGVYFIALDVTQPESVKKAVAELIQKENRIDYLINNAGMGITGPIEETPLSEIKRVFDTNYFGVINVINEVLPVMRNQKSGSIINITSIAGYMGLPFRGIYSATKGALELTTEAYRMEIKDFGVKMANIAPGDFATNIAAGRYHAPVCENSPYKAKYQTTLDLMDQHVDAGKDPMIMAERVYEVMQKENPRIHYKVGEWLQKFSVALKHVLPDKIYEKMLMKHYKI